MNNRLQQLRWERNLSQQQLSIKSGVGRKTIDHIENGVIKAPSVYTALKLAKSLSVSVEDIFML